MFTEIFVILLSPKMQRLAAVLTVVCILLCLAFNYTFPLHRESSKWVPIDTRNRTAQCGLTEHHVKIADRTKKMANIVENALKKVVDSTQDFGKNIYDHLNTKKHTLSGDDLRQYEQLVIMKKYPYLDLKELELKYSPSGKNIRQNMKYETGSNIAGISGICEPLEDRPNVEIINRGLSGFAIPDVISKTSNVVIENKLSLNSLKNAEDASGKTDTQMEKKSTEKNDLRNLKNDIIEFEERKIKIVE